MQSGPRLIHCIAMPDLFKNANSALNGNVHSNPGKWANRLIT